MAAAAETASGRKPAKLSTTRRMNTQKKALTRPRTSVWATSSRFPDEKVKTPGPAAYKIPFGNRLHGRAPGDHRPGYSFRQRTTGAIGTGFTRKKKISHESATPGPGRYEASGMSKAGKTFSPLLSHKHTVTPGPADYATKVNTLGNTGEKYTLRARTKSAWSADMGADWKQKSLHKSKSAPAFYKGLIADVGTPGPGQYEPFKPIGTEATKKSIQFHLNKPQPNYPGPSAYSPGDRLIGKDQAHTYSMHMRTKNKLGGSFIQGDTDGHFVPHTYNPGPGAYNHTGAFHKQSFSKYTPASTNSSVQYFKAPVAEYDASLIPPKAKVY